jgi:glutamine synthetase
LPNSAHDLRCNALSGALIDFLESTGFSLKFAIELEFYLDDSVDREALQRALMHKASAFDIGLGLLKEERGAGQYEIHTLPTSSPTALAQAVGVLRETIAQHGGNVEAKPFADQPGNGMHIHVSLWDAEDRPLCAKTGDEESPVMRYAIAGLLSRMRQSMHIFVPTEASRKRFDGSHDVPSTLSWGGNNRTVALRIPESSADPASRHIEHRVPGMDADPYRALTEVILGIQQGLVAGQEPATPKIWGNASDAQYGLEALAI